MQYKIDCRTQIAIISVYVFMIVCKYGRKETLSF